MSLLLLLPGAGVGAPSDDREFTATWDQAAATWGATATETFSATASFTQAAATWDATLAETFASSGTWEQAAAAWNATASTPQPITGTATWSQAAATWGATVIGPELDQDAIALFLHQQRHPRRRFKGVFVQEAASWQADMNTNDDDLAITFLLGGFDRKA